MARPTGVEGIETLDDCDVHPMAEGRAPAVMLSLDDISMRIARELRDALDRLARAMEADACQAAKEQRPSSQSRSKCIARDHDACACKTCLLAMIVSKG